MQFFEVLLKGSIGLEVRLGLQGVVLTRRDAVVAVVS